MWIRYLSCKPAFLKPQPLTYYSQPFAQAFGLSLGLTCPHLSSAHQQAMSQGSRSSSQPLVPPLCLLPYCCHLPPLRHLVIFTTQKGWCYHSNRKTVHYLPKEYLSSFRKKLGDPAQVKCPQRLAELNKIKIWKKEPTFIDYLLCTSLISLALLFGEFNWKTLVKCLLSPVPNT